MVSQARFMAHQICMSVKANNHAQDGGQFTVIAVKSLIMLPWISNHMISKVWGEITYPFPNFNGATVEVWEWISNLIPHFMMD